MGPLEAPLTPARAASLEERSNGLLPPPQCINRVTFHTTVLAPLPFSPGRGAPLGHALGPFSAQNGLDYAHIGALLRGTSSARLAPPTADNVGAAHARAQSGHLLQLRGAAEAGSVVVARWREGEVCKPLAGGRSTKVRAW